MDPYHRAEQMTQDEFTSALLALRNTDTIDTIVARLKLPPDEWGLWLDDPAMQFLLLDHEPRKLVWGIIQDRRR